jgi:ribosomal protein S8
MFENMVQFHAMNLIIFPCLIIQFGYIVLTTSAGIMDHEEARRKNVGGKVLGFFY